MDRMDGWNGTKYFAMWFPIMFIIHMIFVLMRKLTGESFRLGSVVDGNGDKSNNKFVISFSGLQAV